MKDRCYNTRHKNYYNYGGRGIKVCKKWRDSFLLFIEDMGYKKYKNLSLDRIDNNGNYQQVWAYGIVKDKRGGYSVYGASRFIRYFPDLESAIACRILLKLFTINGEIMKDYKKRKLFKDKKSFMTYSPYHSAVISFEYIEEHSRWKICCRALRTHVDHYSYFKLYIYTEDCAIEKSLSDFIRKLDGGYA